MANSDPAQALELILVISASLLLGTLGGAVGWYYLGGAMGSIVGAVVGAVAGAGLSVIDARLRPWRRF